MPTVTITAGPSNRSLSGTNNQEMEFFTLLFDPVDLTGHEEYEVVYEFTGTPLYDNVVQTGYIDPPLYPDFNYCGFQKVGTFNLQLFVQNRHTYERIASSNVWTWSVTA